MLLAAASVVAVGLNYVFLLATGRLLGSGDYGAFAALLGLLTLILLPTGAVQLAVSREISRRIALGDADGADAFSRAALRLGLLLTAPLVAVALVFVIPLRELLDIDSTEAVALAAVGLVAALVFPVAMGALQGYQRFHAVAVLYVLPFAVRLGLLGIIAAVGYRLGGAMLAAIVGGIAAAALAIVLLRQPLRRSARTPRPALGSFLRYLWPVVVGLIGIAVLTNVDLLVVKARFSDDAGAYAAASAFARVAFFLPATILAVLFPRTAARQARGEDTADILGRSLLVTAAFGALLTLFYAMTGRGLVYTSFGADFASGGELLVPFTISMVLFALANALVGYHLSRDERRYAWIVAATVPVQVAVLAVVPDSPRGVIWADVAIGVALIAVHEVAVGSSVGALRAGARVLTREIHIARGTVVEAALVFLGLTLFVTVLFWPLVSDLSTAVVGPGSDAKGTIWVFWRMQHEGYHVFGTTTHPNVGAPFGSEDGNGIYLQSVLPYYPAYLATKIVGAVAAYNLVLLSGYVLSGASMYLFTRYLGCSRLVCAWAGLVYIVFPWHLARTPHASLAHLELLPLALLVLVAASRRPSWTRISLVAVVTFCTWLTAGYLGAMVFVAVATFAVVFALTARSRSGFKFAAGSLGAAFGATVFAGVLSIVSGFGRGAGLDRVVGDLSVYGLRPAELIVPSAQNWVLSGWLTSFYEHRIHGSNPTETNNYLGLLTIGLALAWVGVAVLGRSRLDATLRRATLGLAAIVVIALALGAPSPIGILGHLVPTPSRIVWQVIPAIRVPSRWVALAMTALIPLAALGLQAGWRALDRRGRSVAKVALVGVAIAVSLVELTISPTRSLERTTLPAEYTALERTPPGILADYPLGEDIDRLFWQREHRRPVLNTGVIGSAADQAQRALLHPGAPGTAEALALLGVTAIVTHPDALDYRSGVPDVPGASWGPGYALVTRTGDGSSVWRVVAPAAPALIYFAGGFGDPERPDGTFIGFPFTSPSGVGTIEIRAKAPSIVRLSLEASPPTGRSQVLRLADDQTELSFTLDEQREPVSTLVQVPRGHSYILVKTDPAATSAEDAIVMSAPRATTSAATNPQLRAVLISPNPGF